MSILDHCGGEEEGADGSVIEARSLSRAARVRSRAREKGEGEQEGEGQLQWKSDRNFTVPACVIRRENRDWHL